MIPTLPDVLDAIVTDVNAHVWSQSFTAEREYNPVLNLKDLEPDTLYVTVVPLSRKSKKITRKGMQKDVEIGIGVRMKLTTTENSEIDPLVILTEEIADWLTENPRLASLPEVHRDDEVKMIPMDDDMLKNKRTFFSCIMFTLRSESL